MSLHCCYTSEKTPGCMSRRHGNLPMCLRHVSETIRRAILDQEIPRDCFREIVQFTDNYLTIKQMAKSHEINQIVSAGRAERERETQRRNAEDCVVYYVRLTGQRIKIGWTADLNTRMKSFRARAVDILAIEPGDYEVETRRHRQFAHLRIGRSEEFNESPELLSHIESLRAAA